MRGRRLAAAAATMIAGPALVTLTAFTSADELIPALLYLLAVALATVVGGSWFGLGASICSFVPFDYFFTSPKHEFGAAGPGDAVEAAAFAVTAVLVSELLARQQRATSAAGRARADAERLRAAAEATADQAGRLQRLTEALSGALTPQQVLDAVVTSGVRAAEAHAGLIALVTVTGRQLEIVASRGYRPEIMTAWRRFPLVDDLPLSRAVLAGEPVFVSSREERDELFPRLAGHDDPGQALACLPLVVEGRAIGGLTLSFDGPQQFDEARRDFKLTIARHVAQALDRSRLYETERRLREKMSFLAEASVLLSSSLDYEQTLARLAEIAVPVLADWCVVDMLSEDGRGLVRLGVAHEDPEMVRLGRELGDRYPLKLDAPYGVPKVLRTGEPELVPEITDELLVAAAEGDQALVTTLRSLRLNSSIIVPLVVRGHAVGALTLILADSERRYSDEDLELAQELAQRAAIAVDSARLFRAAEQRGDAARALSYVADAVVLLDGDGRVRHWNTAAERLFGLPAADVLGKELAERHPGWNAIAEHVPLVEAGAEEIALTATLPLARNGGERWASISGVDFGLGTVYALRDVTDEHELERTRADFVATASHELRTPLAAIYGAIRTLRRDDLALVKEETETFLEMIETEAERLRVIVSQLLIAGTLDAGSIDVLEEPVDVGRLASELVDSARVAAPETIELRLDVPDEAPNVVADEERLRQVLINLLDNAIKYSPDGGAIEISVGSDGDTGSISVRDHGLGIPPDEQARIFEKFYRLDPSLTRGVGGTGLGLYIARELVTRMRGRLEIESSLGNGSIFTVRLPVAD